MLWQYLLSTSTFCIKFCDFNDTFVADVNGQKFILRNTRYPVKSLLKLYMICQSLASSRICI